MTASRNKILASIKENQPELVALPVIDTSKVIAYTDTFEQFKTVLESIGGNVILLPNWEALQQIISEEKITEGITINTVAELDEMSSNINEMTATQLEKLERVYVKGTLGVAENGAVWVYESQLLNRLTAFICQHLVLIIRKKDIVDTLHQAYEKIEVNKEGFGLFIAGPSKTADIEQSLVIGAHGARSTTVYVIE
jgi:L-lactate dehydrogenase complex protein LldG